MMANQPDILGARAAASRLIDLYGIERPAQIVIEDMAMDRGVYTLCAPLEGSEAYLLRSGRRGFIRVSDRIAEVGRRRFAIGHELGHWERHASLSQIWLCTSDDIHAYKGSNAELEANAFSGELLMPRSMLRPRLNGGVSIALLCQLAEEFQTTLTATAVRLVEETNEDCYVAFSHEGHITWWKRNDGGSGLWLHKNQAIHPDSVAFSCIISPSASQSMVVVPTEAWFPDVRYGEDFEVWEESVLLGDYDVVLSLICVVPG